MADGSKKSVEVETNKLVLLADCNLQTKSLLGGQLLKWMDIVACLAGKFFTFSIALYELCAVVTMVCNIKEAHFQYW